MDSPELLDKLTFESPRLLGTEQQRNLASALARSRLYGDEAGIRIAEMRPQLKAAGLPQPRIDVDSRAVPTRASHGRS